MKKLKKAILDNSNYGKITTDDIQQIARDFSTSPQEIENIALDLGLQVEGIY